MFFPDTIDPSAKLRIVLRNHQKLLGDRLAMTSFVRDIKSTYPNWQIFVDVENDGVWQNNPNIDGVILPGKQMPEKIDFTWDVGPGKATQNSKANGVHLVRAFAWGWTRQTGLPVKPGAWRPDIYLSPGELEFHPVPGEYWVFNADTNNMGSKRWTVERWRELIRSRPEVHFVQVGLAKDALADYSDEPNVTSLVGQTTERQLFALVAHAGGCIGLLSSLVHIAAACGKPCVVLAGGREPDTFAHYPGHYYISRIGMLDCCRQAACWHNSIQACKDQVETPAGPVARCMTLIEPADVARGLDLYTGSRVTVHGPQTLRIVTNGKCLGGAERSVVQIAKMFRGHDWQVEIATRQPMCTAIQEALAGVAVETSQISKPCEALLWYASDQVFDADKPEFEPLQRATAVARRKVMALTYKLGKVPDLGWCQGWDQYLFLSSTMRDAFISKSAIINHQSSMVLAPAVDLSEFLRVQPDYSAPVQVVRHSSQGDNKWPLETAELIEACPQVLFHFMPGPSWLAPSERVTINAVNSIPVPEFLRMGNLFVYLLPPGYTDQGPRVIVEAMAAGLPVIAEARDGAVDRVTPETGWLVSDWRQAAEIINAATPEVLMAKGRAARERARQVFDSENWYRAISGETA